MKNETPESQVQFTLITVTPTEAKAMLNTLDGRQRWLKDSHVDFLFRQMANGEWRPDTAEPVKISTEGKLLDGQHRMAAIVKYGMPVKLWVATNVPADVYNVLDNGVSRTPSDQLKAMHSKYPRDTAAVIRQLVALEGMWEGSSNRGRLSAVRLEQELRAREELIYESIREAVPGKNPSPFVKPVPIFRALYILGCEGAPEETKLFFNQLIFGESIKRGDPAYALRSWLVQKFGGTAYGGGAGVEATVKLVAVRTMNAFYAGKSLQKIGYKVGSKVPPLKFPKKGRKKKADEKPKTLGGLVERAG